MVIGRYNVPFAPRNMACQECLWEQDTKSVCVPYTPCLTRLTPVHFTDDVIFEGVTNVW